MGRARSWDEARAAAKRRLERSGHAQQQPVFLVCGQTGVGKTTTINYLFGRRVGAVGQFTRGTTKDKPYVWEAGGEHVHVIDLPGFGDTAANDRVYREMYRKHVPRANGFIVVATPTRPGIGATPKTVKTLLDFGADPSQIVFGYNRLSLLNTEDGDGEPVRIVGLQGPQTQAEKDVIEKGRRQFFEDVRAMGDPRVRQFHLEQFIPYDAKSGWNVFEILWQLVNSLPHSVIVEMDSLIDTSMADFHELVGRRIGERREALERREQEIRTRMNQAQAELGAVRAGNPPRRGKKSSGAKPKPPDTYQRPSPAPAADPRSVVAAGQVELAAIAGQKAALSGEAAAAHQVVTQSGQVRKGLWEKVKSVLGRVVVEAIVTSIAAIVRHF